MIFKGKQDCKIIFKDEFSYQTAKFGSLQFPLALGLWVSTDFHNSFTKHARNYNMAHRTSLWKTSILKNVTKDRKGSHQTMKNLNLFTNLHKVCKIYLQFSLIEELFIHHLPLTKYTQYSIMLEFNLEYLTLVLKRPQKPKKEIKTS